MTNQTKGVVTWDLEGKITTFDDQVVKQFQYSANEIVGKKRATALFPGLVSVGHLNKWLMQAKQNGEFSIKTVLVGKDKKQFAANVCIKPIGIDTKHTGFEATILSLPDVDPQTVMPQISRKTKIGAFFMILRGPFLTAAIVPILIGTAWVVAQHRASPFPWAIFILTFLGGVLLHATANTFNDYFDWKSGVDKENLEYFTAFSGGSRGMELGIISEQKLLLVAICLLALATAIGIALVFLRDIGILIFGAIGAFSAFFYTAPPLRLSARKGLGELFVGMNFGPLMVSGTIYTLSGTVNVQDFLVGLPIGLLTTAILWVNQFPDAPSDAATGKNHLVVVLGKRNARWGYLALLGLAFLLILAGPIVGILPWLALVPLLTIPLAIYAARIVFQHYQDRSLIRASTATIQLHLIAGLTFAGGLFASSFF